MFRITEDPSSESLYSAWLKNCNYDSTVTVDMDKVGVAAASQALPDDGSSVIRNISERL